jgi:hypothetical protein
MYADRVTESMQVAIDETDRRRAIQEADNLARGIQPTTIVKEIHDLNERLRVVAESTTVYTSERGVGEFSSADRAKVEALVARMEAEMKAAAKALEFERAAALRDEVQQIRLRVLEQDASIVVGKAAERAGRSASGQARGLDNAAASARGRRGAAAKAAGPALEVTSITVLPADEEPGIDDGTAADWLPGIRDEHDDEGGTQARWLDRPTWDRTVTPNIRKRTGQRPGQRR